MFIYFFVYSVCFLFMFFDRPTVSVSVKKKIMSFCIVILTLFFGLRWQCGTDWDQYYEHFKNVNWENFWRFYRYGNQNLEVGFAFVNVFLKTLGDGSYTFYLLITNLCRFLLIAYTSFKLSKYPIITFFGFLSLQYMFPTRNPYATALFFIGFVFIKNKEFRKYVVTWIGACSIHISSLVVFPIYFLRGKRLKFKYQILIYVSTILFAALFSSILQEIGASITLGYGTIDDKIEVYSQAFRESETTRGFVSKVIPLFFLCLFEYVRRHTYMKDGEKTFYDFMVICYIIATGIWNLLMDTMPDLCRYVEFINTWPLLFPYVLAKYRKYFGIIVVFLFCYYLYRMNNTIGLGLYRDLFVPYKSIYGTL